MFCAIVAGDAAAEVVRRWPHAWAIVPLEPVTPGHVIVLPTVHVVDAAEDPAVTGATTVLASELAAGWGDDFNLIINAGPAATQTVPHLHVHLVPRRVGDGLPLPWTPQQDAEQQVTP